MTRTFTGLVLTLSIVGFGLVSSLGSRDGGSVSAQAKFDLTGNWAVDVQTDQGGGNPAFTLKQDGTKLTGKYKGLFGEADLTGEVTGKTVKITFSADAQGTPIKIVYDGEIVSNDAFKGKVDLGGLGQGTFSATRQK